MITMKMMLELNWSWGWVVCWDRRQLDQPDPYSQKMILKLSSVSSHLKPKILPRVYHIFRLISKGNTTFLGLYMDQEFNEAMSHLHLPPMPQ